MKQRKKVIKKKKNENIFATSMAIIRDVVAETAENLPANPTLVETKFYSSAMAFVLPRNNVAMHLNIIMRVSL